MTAKGVLSFLVWLIHMFAMYGVASVIFGAGLDTFDALVTAYFVMLGGVFSWALCYGGLGRMESD